MQREDFCLKKRLSDCHKNQSESLKFTAIKSSQFPNEIYWFLDSFFEKLSDCFRSDISSPNLNSALRHFLRESTSADANCPKSKLINSALEKLSSQSDFAGIRRRAQTMNSEVLFCKNFSLSRLSYFLHALTGFSQEVLNNSDVILLWLKMLLKMVIRLQEQKKTLQAQVRQLSNRRQLPGRLCFQSWYLDDLSSIMHNFQKNHLNFFQKMQNRHLEFKQEMASVRQMFDDKIRLGKKNFLVFRAFHGLDRQYKENLTTDLEKTHLVRTPMPVLKKKSGQNSRTFSEKTPKMDENWILPKRRNRQKSHLQTSSGSSKDQAKSPLSKTEGRRTKQRNLRHRTYPLGAASGLNSPRSGHQRAKSQMKMWNSNKPIFCWDGDFNLDIVCEHFCLYVSELFGKKPHSNAKIIREMTVRQFTMFKKKPNLVAFKVKLGSKFKLMVESAWEKGSPSKYFKFKVDLAEEARICLWNRFEEIDEEREITSFEKTPGRYNISQAKYVLSCDNLSVENLNKKIIQKICERLDK